MASQPRVALVHDFLVKLGGAERVLKALADMYPKAPIFTLLYDEQNVGGVFPRERVRPSRLERYPHALRKRQRYLLPLMPRAIEAWSFADYDLVISSSSAFAHGIVAAEDTLHVTYFHSPMRYAWDWYHEYKQEQNVGRLKKTAITLLLHRIRQWDRAAADRTDLFIANSENVRRRIRKYYRTDAAVVYPPVDLSRFAVHADHENYFLIVSTLTPYKRIDLAVQLWSRIGKRLLVIGDGSQREYLQSIAASNVEFLGFKSDDVVTEYMKHCRALIFPGEDDFGITPVEAMACGKPVLALGAGGALETVTPGVTGEFFNEPTVASLEAGLIKLFENEPDYHPFTIKKHTEKFDSVNFPRRVKKLIREANSIKR